MCVCVCVGGGGGGGGLTKLINLVLNWETVSQFRIDTSSEFHSVIQF